MAQEIRIPDIGGDVEEVEVVEILVAAGDEVGVDDPVIVIESDKASMDVPAGIAGVIDSIEVSVGDQVSEGQVIARLKESADKAGNDSAEESKESGKARESGKAKESGKARESSKAKEPPKESSKTRESSRDDESSKTKDAGSGEASAAERPKPAKTERGDAAGKRQSEAKGRRVEVRVPDIGEAENVEVIEVAVKAGDEIAPDDVLVVVESDKASMDIPSTHGGKVVEVHVGEGTQVEEGTLLVTLELEAGDKDADEGSDEDAVEDDDDGEASEAAAPEPEEHAQEPRREETAERKAAGKDAGAEKGRKRDVAKADDAPTAGVDVYAGPAVRRLARELGADLAAVRGTGNRGRIVKDDVKAYVKERLTAGPAAPGKGAGLPPLPVIDFSKFGKVEEQPLSRIRARGADNLQRSWLNIPHVTQHDDVDVTDLEDFRATLRQEGEARGIKITPLAFIIKACCQALKEFPTVNASLDPAAKTFYLKRYYHIGVAVDTPDGLVVPVVRDADQKGIWELSEEVAELAEKARNKKLSVNEMQGGSFSVSSLGTIGGTGFTPIINGPEVAILGVGRLTVRPHWNGKEFVPRKMLPLSLSYDHRAINGAEAGRFVARLGALLGDIRLLAL